MWFPRPFSRKASPGMLQGDDLKKDAYASKQLVTKTFSVY